MEVVWTGLNALKEKNFTLTATTSLWMFFIYGMIIFFEPICVLLAPLPLIARGVLYTCIIFLGEFVTGSLLKRIDVCPWDYSGSKYHVKGIIRLDYAPVWFVVGLIYERIYYWIA